MKQSSFKPSDLPSDLNEVPQRNLIRLLKRIRTSDNLTPRDRDTLGKFYSGLVAESKQNNDFGGHHFFDLLGDMFRIAEETNSLTWSLIDGPAGQAAIDRMMRWVQDKEFSSYVTDDYFSTMRLFGGFMTEGDRMEWPDRFEKIPTGMRGDVDPAPKKTNIITYEDAGAMAQEVFNVRDPATIMTQWSSGARPLSEWWKLTFEQVEDHETHFTVSLPTDSKTGRRDIRLHVGAPQLRKWLKNHPAQDTEGGPDPDDPIWAKTTANERISYTMYREIFYSAAERAGITKDHNPGHFRKSRASVLSAKKFVSQVDLENHFGWVRGSDSAQHYITRFSGETARHIAEADGVEIEEDDKPDPISPVKCLTCDRLTPRYSDTCIWCDADVDPEKTISIDDMEEHEHSEDLLTLVLDGEVSARDLIGVKRVLPVIKARPEILDRLDELISLLEKMDSDTGKGIKSPLPAVVLGILVVAQFL